MLNKRTLAFISYYQKMTQADMNEQKKYFKCFELFYRTWKNLPDDIRVKYYDALMEYWIYWTEPTDPIILSLLQWAIHSIDKTDEKRKQKSEYMKWNQNAVKNFENISKQRKTENNRDEQKQTDKNIWKSYFNNTIISSSSKEKENRKEKERNEMLDVFRKDDRLIRFMEEEDVIRWRDFKQSSKKPYKDIKSFITALVKIKNDIAKYNWRPKSDRNRRNRFNFVVGEAIEHEREWLRWYDSLESVYESSKDDLYPNPKQNE